VTVGPNDGMTDTDRAVTVRSVPWDHADATALRAAMAQEMSQRYADRITEAGLPAAQAVAADEIAYTGLAVDEHGRAVGHVALRWIGADLEMKRVYVVPGARGRGVAAALLAAVEREALARGAARLVLQTGDRQPDAVRLYERNGYAPIPVFPPYDTLPFSLCFARTLAATTPERAARTPHRC
jgi:GNAT superfamily N-acetyltransferase